MTEKKVYKRYSENFKRQVVAEYEDGAMASELCRKYGIGNPHTVTKWVTKYGRERLRHKVVHIQTPEEADQLRQLEHEREVLRQAVAELTVKNLLLEGQVQAYQETYGQAVLKKNGPRSSSPPTPAAQEA
jgi:transposase-like protein